MMLTHAGRPQQSLQFTPPPVPPNATRLLWEAAGRPTLGPRDVDTVVDYSGPCWWCGVGAPGLGRSRSCLTATFPWPLEAAAPDAPALCLPCGWTLCDRVTLPAEYAEARLRMKAKAGRRQVLSLRGGPITRLLLLELDDGTVGLWEPGPTATSEKPWQAAVKSLRGDPRAVEPCEYLEAVPYSDLSTGPVEKFRAYHHFATTDRWWVCTDSDRMAIRDWILDPPGYPWIGVIGDGKKHHALAAVRAGAVSHTRGLDRVYYQGAVVTYTVPELAELVGAIEELIRAGAGDDEIESGRYSPHAGVGWLLAHRAHEPTVSPYRGGSTLPLALYMRRTRKELTT